MLAPGIALASGPNGALIRLPKASPPSPFATEDAHVETTEFQESGRQLLDLIVSYLEEVESRPLFPDVTPGAVEALFDEPLPLGPLAADRVISELKEKLLPYTTAVNHPGYMGLITPSPLPMGVLADFLTSALNQNIGVYSIGPAAVAMERRTVRWLTDLVGYGPQAGGNLTSGGTMANFIALKLARDWASGQKCQHEGLREPLVAYVSEERHVSVDKAVDAVGLGRHQLRIIPTDSDFRMRLDLLEDAVKADQQAGRKPACLIGMGGSTNTGAVDDLAALRVLADRTGMWLHVDAAYGGGLLLSHKRRHALAGLELADSVTLDPHKWFFAPLDVGAVLVKDAAQLTRSFGMQPSYLTAAPDAQSERYDYYVHGFEQSRRFRSLKVWMSFKRYGAEEIGRWVDLNCEQAERLWKAATASGEFEAARKPALSAVCLRYVGGRLAEDRRTALHHEVARRAEQLGRFWFATTVLKGKTYFRINPVNFRTRLEHMDELFAFLRQECGAAAQA
jgi:aromatic-L-amino-acid decarboxylase